MSPSRDSQGTKWWSNETGSVVAAATRRRSWCTLSYFMKRVSSRGLMAEPHALEQLWQNTNLGEGEEVSIAVLNLGLRNQHSHFSWAGARLFSVCSNLW